MVRIIFLMIVLALLLFTLTTPINIDTTTILSFKQKFVELFQGNIDKFFSNFRVPYLLLGSSCYRLSNLLHTLSALGANVGKVVIVQIEQVYGEFVRVVTQHR